MDLFYEKSFGLGDKLLVLGNIGQRAMKICRLLKQFRHAPRKFQYAFPRGFGEPEITSEENVKKELLEEIGAVQVEETYLGKVLPDSGILANQVDVFMCKVSNVEVKSFYEGIQDVVLLNEAELDEWILKKRLKMDLRWQHIACIR